MQFQTTIALKLGTRRYPGGILGNIKLKDPSPDQIFIFWGEAGDGGVLGNSKFKFLTKFSFRVGSLPRIGYSGQNESKILKIL